MDRRGYSYGVQSSAIYFYLVVPTSLYDNVLIAIVLHRYMINLQICKPETYIRRNTKNGTSCFSYQVPWYPPLTGYDHDRDGCAGWIAWLFRNILLYNALNKDIRNRYVQKLDTHHVMSW